MKKYFNYDDFQYKYRYQKERANATLTTIQDLEEILLSNKEMLGDNKETISSLKDCVYNNKPDDIVDLIDVIGANIITDKLDMETKARLITEFNRLVFQSVYLKAPAGYLKNIIMPERIIMLLAKIYINYLGFKTIESFNLAKKYHEIHHIGNNRTDKFPGDKINKKESLSIEEQFGMWSITIPLPLK